MIVGARNTGQLEQNLRALDWRLSSEEMAEVEALAAGRAKE